MNGRLFDRLADGSSRPLTGFMFPWVFVYMFSYKELVSYLLSGVPPSHFIAAIGLFAVYRAAQCGVIFPTSYTLRGSGKEQNR